jgi:hypothetical protein
MYPTKSENPDTAIARHFARDLVRASLTRQVIRVGGLTRLPPVGGEDQEKESQREAQLALQSMAGDLATIEKIAEANEEVLEWLRKAFHDYAGGGSAPPPPRPHLANLVLPTATADFSDAPVGGWSNLSLWPDGAYQFSGHLHVSGAPSYDDSVVWVVASCAGTAFVFSHTGRLHGTFEKGSRDDDWGDTGTNQAIADAWDDLSNCWQYECTFAVNADIGELIDAATSALGVGGKVVTIVSSM